MLKYGYNIGVDPPDVFPFTGHPTKCIYENLEVFLGKKTNIGKNIHKNEWIELAEEKNIWEIFCLLQRQENILL